MASQEIMIAGFHFDEFSIESINSDTSVSLSGEEFQADSFESNVFFYGEAEAILNLPFGTEVFYYNEGTLVGKYYLKTVERTALNKYLIYATSMIGILDYENYYGAFLSGGTTLGRAISRIVGGDGLTEGNITHHFVPYRACKYKASVLGTESARGVRCNSISSSWGNAMHVEFSVNGTKSGVTVGSVSYVAGCFTAYDSGYNIERGYAVGVKIGDAVSTGHYITLYIQYGKYRIELFTDDAIADYYKPSFTVDIVPYGGYVSASAEYSDSSHNYSFNERAEIGTASAYASAPSINYVGGAVPYNSYWNNSYCYVDFIFKSYKVYDEDGKLAIDACPILWTRAYTNTTTTVYGITNLAHIGRDSSSYSGLIYQNSAFDNSSTSFLEPFDCGQDIIEAKYISRYIDFFSNIEYGPGTDSLIVRGWIPICTKREAIYQMLFSQSLSMIKSGEGKMLIIGLTNNTSGTIPDGSIYDNGREERVEASRTISLTEHSYEVQSESEVIFDNTSAPTASAQYVAVFKNSPINGTVTGSGVHIYKYNCNCALCDGRGTITGVPFRHSQNIITNESGNSFGSDVNVSNATMVTAINSDNVMKRLAAYYGTNLKRFVSSFVYDGQRCGLVYSFKSPFNQVVTAYITKMSTNASTFVKSECEFISGYVPSDVGGYTNYAIVHSDSTTWSIPSSVYSKENPQIRINLIGQGLQGSSGTDGEPGGDSNGRSYGKGGKGGKGGDGGLGGQIYTVTVDITSSMKTLVFSRSGQNTVIQIQDSSNSTLRTYYSSSGNRSPTGFTNVFTGVVYALPGAKGIDGGKGGDGGVYYRHTNNSDQERQPQAGESVNGQSGGSAGAPTSTRWNNPDPGYVNTMEYTYGGRGGGGASYSSPGQSSSFVRGRPDRISNYTGGKGADGGNPAPNQSTFGCGGSGGNGGGGSGGASSCEYYYYWMDPPSGDSGSDVTYHTMTGCQEYGKGGQGADGNYGCAIVYY